MSQPRGRKAEARALSALAVAIIIATPLAFLTDVLAASDNRRLSPKAVDALLTIADEACVRRGASAENLRDFARESHWKGQPDASLRRSSTKTNVLIGGWTLTNKIGSLAVIQSRVPGSKDCYICSVTTSLQTMEQHRQVKRAFEQRFMTAISVERDSPVRHFDEFWIVREGKPRVKAALLFSKARKALTIQLSHGYACPQPL